MTLRQDQGNKISSSVGFSNTRVCGLIGDPVEHSMSPAMHNAAFAYLGLDYIYLPFRVRKEDVEPAVRGMKAFSMRGLNVTIPHKMAVMRCLDRTDDVARKIGAVNTIVNDGGVLTGYNTDVPGFLQTLLEKGIRPEGRTAVVIGAGGAARAIAFALMSSGAKVRILNRTLDRAEELARQVGESFGEEPEASELNRKNLARSLDKADIVVNTTSVGMRPVQDESPIPIELLRAGLTIYDVVYNPVKTRLLREAEKAGAVTISGLDMLVWQGALAFEKWTGHKAPVELMRKEAIKRLQKA